MTCFTTKTNKIEYDILGPLCLGNKKHYSKKKKKKEKGNSPVVLWLELLASTAGGPDLILGQGTKILQATWGSQKKEEDEAL